MEPQNYCLKWKKQTEQFQNTLAKYIDHQLLCDVTIASDGEVFKAHQFVLSASSSYFEKIFSTVPSNKHPIIFLKDITSLELKTIIDYMYKGQTVVSSELLPKFLKTCQHLKIHGLCEQTLSTSQEAEVSSSNETRETSKRKYTSSVNTDSETKSILSSRKRTESLQLARSQKIKRKNRKNTGDISQTISAYQENSEHVDLTQTNENLMHKQTTGQSLVSQQLQQENEINCNTIEVVHIETSLNKTVHLEENVGVPATDSTNITQDANQCLDRERIQSSILDSPVYSQTSFIFDVDSGVVSKLPNHQVLSTQCLIIDDCVPEVVEISDDENCESNVELQRVQGCSQDSADCSVVKLDGKPQNVISKDVNLHTAQDSESDDSEIRSQCSYFRRHRVFFDRNLSEEDSDIFSKETEPNSPNSETIKSEALKRAQNMRVLLSQENFTDFEKIISEHETKLTSLLEISKSPKVQEETVQSVSDCEEQNQWLKSFNLVNKQRVPEKTNKKLQQKLPERRLRPRTPKPTKKGS